MQRVRSRRSWQVTIDIPQELIFLGQLAQQNNYHVPDIAAPSSTAEAGWQKWWQEMPEHTYATISAQVRERMPKRERVRAVHEAREEHLHWFDPPYFSNLSQYPDLQLLSQQAWPAFVTTWQSVGGEGLATLDEIHHHLVQENLGEQFARTWSMIAPHKPPLQISLIGVLWPLGYERWLTPTHLLCDVLSVTHATAQAQWVQRIVTEIAARQTHE